MNSDDSYIDIMSEVAKDCENLSGLIDEEYIEEAGGGGEVINVFRICRRNYQM